MAIDAPAACVEQAVAAIRKAGFDPQPVPEAAPRRPTREPDRTITTTAPIGRRVAPGLALLLAIGAELVGFFAPDTQVWKGAGLAVAAAAIWLAGFDVYKKGLTALRHGRLNINALMTVAVTGAFVIGQWPEAAMVMALYAIAEAIEARAVDRARNAIKGLLAMAPEEAVGAPGRRQLVDRAGGLGGAGRHRCACGRANACRWTAWCPPAVPASTRRRSPARASRWTRRWATRCSPARSTRPARFEFRVTALASNSTLARIIHAVEEAQGTRAPTQGFVDRFAAVYTPAVFVIALAVALLGPWLLDWTWMQAIYKALVLLVIACPCALVISTPVTIVSGLAAAARRGILIKGGIYLEDARKLKAIALDKTGTITEGKPKLVAWEVLDAGRPTRPRPSTSPRCWPATPTIRCRAPSPPACAPNSVEAKDFKAIAGRGVQADIGGTVYVLGNHRLIEERGQCSPALEADAAHPRRSRPHRQPAGVRRRPHRPVRGGRHDQGLVARGGGRR